MTEKVLGSGYFSYRKVRKHVSQMSVQEKNKAREMFKKVKTWRIFDHVNHRIREKEYSITVDDVLQIMHEGDIIEYEQKYYIETGNVSHLLLLQTIRERENGESDIMHMVFDMTDEGIVSVWLNHIDDRHYTLDMGIYSKGLKVGEVYWEN